MEFDLFRNIVDNLSLNLRNILISPLEGEKKFLSELCELRNFREGDNLKNSCSVQYETVLEPSPAFVMLTKVRKRLLPLTKREGINSVIINNLTDSNHSQFITYHSLKRKVAFTLAEVLITLGIIGIVATMTLPTIITNYKVKVLENQFKKADSIIQQAIQNTANEYGYSSITELNMTGHCSAEGYKYYLWLKAEMPNINEIWKLQFLKTKSFDDIDAYHRGMYCNSFFGKKMSATIYSCVIGGGGYMILPDGVTVSPLYAVDGACHNVTMRAAFDTNGPHKGPNRIGYDIFIYQTAEYETLCNPNIVNSENYKGCYYWAHRNVSPQDSSKPYWDVLYKPLSYWKK